MSALFEKMIADLQGKTEADRLDQQTRAYYDALPGAAVQEDEAWGALGEQALAAEDESEPQRADDPQPKLAGAR